MNKTQRKIDNENKPYKTNEQTRQRNNQSNTVKTQTNGYTKQANKRNTKLTNIHTN